ncbi:MAG TPA: hypothetical protein VGG29_08765 [Caulobacteraceae bacterium]|jgi:hypothetical protein
MPDDPKRKDQTKGGEPRSFRAGEEDGYRTDTFSRGDKEGPSPGELAADSASGDGASEGDDSAGASAEPTPDATPLAATDDPASRDADPPRPDQGGVR